MTSELPPEAYAAALASLPYMTIHRLGALLRHHAPPAAYAVASGDVCPSGLIERVLADADIRAAARDVLLFAPWRQSVRLRISEWQ